MPTRHPGVWTALLLPVAVALGGCQEELQKGLSDGQSAEVVAELAAAGIPAKRSAEKGAKAGRGATFSVTVEGARAADAATLLVGLDLPRPPCDPQDANASALPPSPDEERERRLRAAERKLACGLQVIEGVRKAAVSIAASDRDPLRRDPLPGSVSVVIRHDPCVNLQALVPDIKQFVAYGAPGLGSDLKAAYERVKVTVTPAARCSSRHRPGAAS